MAFKFTVVLPIPPGDTGSSAGRAFRFCRVRTLAGSLTPSRRPTGPCRSVTAPPGVAISGAVMVMGLVVACRAVVKAHARAR